MKCTVCTELLRPLELLILSYYSAHVFEKHATFKFEYVLHLPNGFFIQQRLPLASRLEKFVNCGDVADSDLEFLKCKMSKFMREDYSKINKVKILLTCKEKSSFFLCHKHFSCSYIIFENITLSGCIKFFQ